MVGNAAGAAGPPFAAAFRKLTGETPSDWRRRVRWQQSLYGDGNRSGAVASQVR